MIVAFDALSLAHGGPGTKCLEGSHRENHPVGYGVIGHSYLRHLRSISRRKCGLIVVLEIWSRQSSIGAHARANQTVPYGTALLDGAVPATSCLATIAPSLRDKSHRPSK